MTSYKNSEPRLPIMRGSPPALRVPLMDWDRPPWNRWSFQHVREILPTAEVRRGSGAQSVFPQVPQDLDGIVFNAPAAAKARSKYFSMTATPTGSWCCIAAASFGSAISTA
jgi:hypothetical protein